MIQGVTLIVLTEEDLVSDGLTKTFDQIEIGDFTTTSKELIHKSTHVVYTDTTTMHSKIMKDRFGDKGEAIIKIHVNKAVKNMIKQIEDTIGPLK